jgi:hypothetical protein
VRFTPDKSPYKTTTYGLLQGAPGGGAGLYAQPSSRGVYAGRGYYRLEAISSRASATRWSTTAPAPRLAEAAAVARSAGLELAGPSLRTAPRGYTRDHPRIDLLRRKSLIAGHARAGAGGIGRDAALAHVAGAWRAAAPLNAWLDERVGPSASASGHRRRRG